jgi:CBS domain-containing protein
MKTLVKDLMSYPLITIPVESKVSYARELMERKKINALAVVDISDTVEVVGIITSTDLRRVPDDSAVVKDHMNTMIEKVPKRQTAIAAAHRMINERVHHLVVVDEGKPIGMLSSIDFVRMLTKEKERFRSSVMFI